MAYAITPSLGVNLEVTGPKSYYDDNSSTPTPALGSKVVGSDGHTYVFVQAGAAIPAAATAVTINETTWVATAGAGAYATPVANVADDDYFWARSTAL